MKLRKLYPIIWRDMKVTFLNINSLVSHFLVPSMFLLLFATSMSKNFNSITLFGKEVSYFEFFFPGLLGLQMVVLINATISSLGGDKDKYIFAVISFSKTNLGYYLLGRYVSNLLIIGLKMLILYLTAHFVFDLQIITEVSRILLVFATISVGTLLWYNLGFLIGTVLEFPPAQNLVMAIMPTFIIFTSNSYYNTTKAPIFIQIVSKFNPLTYIVQCLRGLFYSAEISVNIYYYLIGILLAGMVFGYLAWKFKRKLVLL